MPSAGPGTAEWRKAEPSMFWKRCGSELDASSSLEGVEKKGVQLLGLP